MGNIILKDFAQQHGLTENNMLDMLKKANIIKPDNSISGVKYAFCERFYDEIDLYESIVCCYDIVKNESWWEITPKGQTVLEKILDI